MNNQQTPALMPRVLFSIGAVAACAAAAAMIFGINGMRTAYSDTDRAASTAAVARMDAAQARANSVRAEKQKRSYKGF